MTNRIPLTLTRLRPAGRRRGHQPVERPEVVVSPPAWAPEARARDAGGPEDNAVYTCCCGMVFSAPVSASVSCPVCAVAQDW